MLVFTSSAGIVYVLEVAPSINDAPLTAWVVFLYHWYVISPLPVATAVKLTEFLYSIAEVLLGSPIDPDCPTVSNALSVVIVLVASPYFWVTIQ